jgi:UDP-2,3-diacylglucosamine pyrophosphatase LpxH
LKNRFQLEIFSQLEEITSIVEEGNQVYLISGHEDLLLKKAVFNMAVQTSNPILQLQDVGADLEEVFKSLTHSNS